MDKITLRDFFNPYEYWNIDTKNNLVNSRIRHNLPLDIFIEDLRNRVKYIDPKDLDKVNEYLKVLNWEPITNYY